MKPSLLSKGLLLAAASAVTLTAVGLPVLAQVTSDPHANPAPTDPTPQSVPLGYRQRISESDSLALRQALAAARSSQRERFAAAYSQISDAAARKLAMWAMVDVAGEGMSFAELDRARTDLIDFPRSARRLQLTEKAIEYSGLSPQQIVAWFNGQPPVTAEGAIALAGAMVQLGREPEARQLIRSVWRDKMFEAGPQQTILSRYSAWLTQDDYIQRLDCLLMGPQGPAAQQIVALVPPDYQQLAQARMAFRAGRGDAMSLADALPDSVRNDRGLAFEKSRWLRNRDRIDEGFALLGLWPQAPAHDDGDQRLYSEARQYFVAAMQRGNWLAAYDAMANLGFAGGERKAEAEFFAGWVALKKLNDPARAAAHFERVREAGRTPITQGRALYWLGRAYEAQGNQQMARSYYSAGAENIGAFYGQLAAEKAGFTTLTLPIEPRLTQADRDAFENRDVVKAIRILSDIGEDNLFRSFVMAYDDSLSTPADFAQLIDLTRNSGQTFTAMMVGRAAAGKGVILPERMYPVMATPQVQGAPDPAFVLAITRQESSFDPRARSPADARGMMMLLPSTARIVARQMGVGYADARLYEADYNMQLGTFHLGQLVDTFQGSYLMTAAGYNAGPGRPAKWIYDCGDPRSAGMDPVDFIECTPFTETRDYMMRVMENMQVYRARLNGGTGALTLSADLKRGAATYASVQPGLTPITAPGEVVTMQPIP